MSAARGRPALSTERAWEIAIAVANPIYGRVQLARGHNSEQIDPSGYEWLDIVLPDLTEFPHSRRRHALEWVARAREACVVWHMLACCDGFGGHENERFWKRLIDETVRRTPDDPNFSRMVSYQASDEYPLSPASPTVTGLPRFRLAMILAGATEGEESDDEEEIAMSVAGATAGEESADDEVIDSPEWWLGTAIRAFVGDDDTTAGCSSTVQSYISSLLYHVNESKFFEHTVELCLLMVNSLPGRSLTHSIRALSAEVETRGREITPAQRRSDLLAGTMRLPVVAFKEIALELYMFIASDARLPSCCTLLPLSAISLLSLTLESY